jgi:phosphopantothenoylcysteine decarboxylase/phosphopantothenate--cysteine ligase
MGYAVAQAARDAGATVVLVSGPVGIDPPAGVEFVPVESAQQMYDAVHRALAAADIYIGAAAVADYQAPAVAVQKIKKSSERMQLEFVRAPDILESVAALTSGRPFVVGFAAETENVEENARAKLVSKRADMIAANRVGDGLAFDCDDNSLLVLWAGGREEIASCVKSELARRLVALIAEVRGSRRRAGAVSAVHS